jgi:Zn-dependent peptidase ImmA (M78 family)
MLYVDPPDDISGGACFLPEFKTVLINRNEPEYRRNYDLGHELFHLLTWDAMPPEKVEIETPSGKGKSRTENLAENFAAGLLMPKKVLETRWKKRKDTEIHEWLMSQSEELGVSGRALYFRLKNLDWIDSVVYEDKLVRHLDENETGDKPALYSKEFVKRLHDVLEKGFVSVHKAAELLDCNTEDIADLFEAYGLEPLVEV